MNIKKKIVSTVKCNENVKLQPIWIIYEVKEDKKYLTTVKYKKIIESQPIWKIYKYK